MAIWGHSSTNTKKPTWTFLTTQSRGRTAPKNANVFASSLGWMMRRPWGDEVIVKIGGLVTQLGQAVVTLVAPFPSSANVVNAASQTLGVTVSVNKPVLLLSGTPTIVAISSQLSPANVTLTYSASDSDLGCGRLVFKNTAVNLAQANAVGCTFTCNSTSVTAGWAQLVDPSNSNTAISTSLPAALSSVVNTSAA